MGLNISNTTNQKFNTMVNVNFPSSNLIYLITRRIVIFSMLNRPKTSLNFRVTIFDIKTKLTPQPHHG